MERIYVTKLSTVIFFGSGCFYFCNMSFNYFNAESHISTYNEFRPNPPKILIERIVDYTLEKFSEPLELAVDVGCGSGQSTVGFAPYFKKVLGLDSSFEIIQEAKKNCQRANVFYSSNKGEKMDIESGTANLVSVCQALHWFDIPKFYSEAERVLMPKGVLAIYGYKLPVPVYKDNREIQKIIEKYYTDVLGPFTLPQSRKVYLENYTSKEYNEVHFVEGKMQREENFLLETEGNINDIIGYIKSWSAFQNYIKLMGEESGQQLLNNFEEEFKEILKCSDDVNEKLKIRFNYFLLLGRKK